MYQLVSVHIFAYLILFTTLCSSTYMDRNRISEEISFLNDVDAAEKVQQLMHIGLRPNRQLNETRGSEAANLSEIRTNSSSNDSRSEESAEKDDVGNSGKKRKFSVHYIHTGSNRNRSKRLYEKNSSFDLRKKDISEKKPHKLGNFLYIKEREIQIFMPKSPIFNRLNVEDNPQYTQSNELIPYVKMQEARNDRISDSGKEINPAIYESNANSNEQEHYGDLSRPQVQGDTVLNQVPGEYPSWYQLKLQSPKNLTQNLKPAVSFFNDRISDSGKEINHPFYEPNANSNEQEHYGDLSRLQVQGNTALNQAPGEYPSWYQLKLQSPKNLTQNLKPAISFFKDEIEQQRYSKEAFKVGQSQMRDVLRRKALPFPARIIPRDSKNDAGFYNTLLERKDLLTTGGFHGSEFEIATQEYQTSAVLQNNSNRSMDLNLRGETINFLFPQNPLNFQLTSNKRNDRDSTGLLGNMLPGSSEKYGHSSELIFKRQPREPRLNSPTNQTGNVSSESTNHNFRRRKKESGSYQFRKYMKRNDST